MSKESRLNRKYGWIPDLPDQRDRFYKLDPAVVIATKSDMRSLCPAVYDQDGVGCCTGESLSR